MLLIIASCVLFGLGIAVVVIWGAERVVAPGILIPPSSDGTGSSTARLGLHLAGLRLYAWWATVFTVIGTASGLLVTGAGGRLVMRVLGATSPQATGRLTEAQARVGDITVDGTVAYLLFGALPFAFASAALYLLVAPWLPPGRLAGPTFGAVLFIVVSPFVDPLRPDNVDFDIVGPGWLAVLLFGALAVVQGAVLAALAGRLSRSLPLMSRQNWPATCALLLPAIALVPIGVLLAIGGLVALAFPRLLPRLLTVRTSRGGVVTGRVLLAVAVLSTLPAFGTAVASIWAR